MSGVAQEFISSVSLSQVYTVSLMLQLVFCMDSNVGQLGVEELCNSTVMDWLIMTW